MHKFYILWCFIFLSLSFVTFFLTISLVSNPISLIHIFPPMSMAMGGGSIKPLAIPTDILGKSKPVAIQNLTGRTENLLYHFSIVSTEINNVHISYTERKCRPVSILKTCHLRDTPTYFCQVCLAVLRNRAILPRFRFRVPNFCPRLRFRFRFLPSNFK